MKTRCDCVRTAELGCVLFLQCEWRNEQMRSKKGEWTESGAKLFSSPICFFCVSLLASCWLPAECLCYENYFLLFVTKQSLWKAELNVPIAHQKDAPTPDWGQRASIKWTETRANPRAVQRTFQWFTDFFLFFFLMKRHRKVTICVQFLALHKVLCC